MAPVEVLVPSPSSSTMESSLIHLKVVDSALQLPVVSDTCAEITKLASPLVETTMAKISPYVKNIVPLVESSIVTIQTKAEENMPVELQKNMGLQFLQVIIQR